MPEKEFVTWDEVQEFIDFVCRNINKENPITGVYGLPRGGLIFAVMLSHKLHVPMLMSPATGCIIVDDICDSGESLLHYVKDTSGIDPSDKAYQVATMYYKPNKLGIIPDLWWKPKEDKWIVFPWEDKEGM